ncbi:MAG TPA: alpha-L-rhamnosidase C-terminal domain-containing protein [Candidatus Binatia bacterium]|nr:alpha-L-rhamnosidase C-terminal domain-containing protein [Candidatus Binatia bacterium]
MRTRFLAVASLALLIASGRMASAQLPPEALKGLWKAQWITSPGATQKDSVVLHFRKVFDISQSPEHFIVHVSADAQFLLCINQQEIGRGPSRSDLAHWRYETYDLAKFLHSGKNEISATVWNFGVTPLAQITDRTAFVVQGDTASESIANTDNNWEVEEEKGIRALPTPSDVERFYYVAEPPERIDGAALDWSWNDAASSHGKWEKPIPIGYASLRGAALQNNNWQLMPDPLPPMQMELTPSGRVVRATGIPAPPEFPSSPFEIPAHAKVSLLLDQSHLTTAYPVLTVTGGAQSTIRLTYAEALFDGNGQKGNRDEIDNKHVEGIYDEFLPDGSPGRQFMPLVWRTWRYLQLDIKTADQPLRLENLRCWFTAFPFEERARFSTDDPSLSPIWQIGWRTARLDAHDTYMDTPYYERMQYIGDTRIQALISYTVAGDDRLARQAIQAFSDSRVPDGLTRSRYPSSVTQMIPTFSLLWIGMLHDFWIYRGDEEFVKAQIPGTRTVLDWFLDRQRPDGLIGNITWWPFIDWGKDFGFGMPPQDSDGGSSPITLQYVEALRYAAELESTFGDPVRVRRYRGAEAQAVAAIRKLCWNDTYGLIADTPAQTHYSQHANILGVWLDVIPTEKQKEVLTKILSTSDPGFTTTQPVPDMTQATYYFRFYLARALDHSGLGHRYLDLLQPWRDMVALGLTTWAEQPEPTRSDCHAWSAHPNFDFLTIVAGIRPKTPGFSSVTVEPHLGRLRNVVSAVPTPKGIIEVSYTSNLTGIDAEIDLPANVSGDFVWKGHITPLHSGHQHLGFP